MERIFQPLLFFLARCSRNQLIHQIEFLKAENELLRKRLPKYRIRTTPAERKKLIKLGEAVGPQLDKLITIVAPSTYRRWVNQLKGKVAPKPVGRPRTPEVIRKLVLKIAKQTGWGYTRILGELRKLGYHRVSRQTVFNILKREGLDPGPKRGAGSWEEFLRMHAETLWQCDFFSKKVLTRTGFRQVFALVFIHVATRRVIVSPCSAKLGGDWVKMQTKSFFRQARAAGIEAKLVMRDNDMNFTKSFDPTAKRHGAEVRHTAIRAPNENAFVERFVQSVKQECLDHFLIFGEKHFDYLVKEYVEYYHQERPHQGIGNKLIAGEPPPAVAGEINCRERLGGLLKHYYHAAA